MLRVIIVILVLVATVSASDAGPHRPAQCFNWGQDGKKHYYYCREDPSMEDEAKAYERMKANRKPEPTTELCKMVKGKLVCK